MQLDPDRIVVEKIGNFHVLGSRLTDVEVSESRGVLLSELGAKEDEVRSSVTLEELKDLPVFRVYRDFFWSTGIDPTKTRPAAEALTRRILRGRPLPRINSFVDALNLASVETRIPFAAFDSGLVEGRLELRFAQADERIHPIGHDRPILLRGKEIVVSDSKKLLAVYPHRDSDETKITEKTTNALVLSCGVPGIELSVIRSALDTCTSTVQRFCGGTVAPE